MILFPPAKINLGLNVLYQREDGFHEIETCMYSIPIFDVLEIIPSDHFKFTQSGLAIPGEPSENLIVRAFKEMKERYAIQDVQIHLRKNIPMGAGLGGGSADAAFTLVGLNELFNLNIENKDLRQLAGLLGSDCAFFIENKPQFAYGRGERLKRANVNLSGYYLKIVNPEIHISTKDAYSNLRFLKQVESIETILATDIHQWKNHLVNDFESSVFEKHPAIQKIKTEMYDEGALYASMSGSGSTVYGIFDSKPTITGVYTFEKIEKL